MKTTTPEEHAEKVQSLSEQLRSLHQDSTIKSLRLQKGGVSHFVPLSKKARGYGHHSIDVSHLNGILKIDPLSKTCVLEPGVCFDDLVRETLKFNLVPKVVPELRGITVGGAVSGCSLESMSYQVGGFHDTCLEYEVIGTDGTVYTLKKPDQELFSAPSSNIQEQDLLFEMIHGSYGTLGILTQLTCELMDAQPYVKMTYVHCYSKDDYLQRIKEEIRRARYPMIDSIIHGPDRFILCLGEFISHADQVSEYAQGQNIPYYLSTRRLQEDTLPTWDYFFRYDADCHWVSRKVPALEWSPVRSWVAPWVLGSTQLISWAQRLEPILSRIQRRPELVCDYFVPDEQFNRFLDWYLQKIQYFPLWILPYQMPLAQKPRGGMSAYPWLNDDYAKQNMSSGLMWDCAIYGLPNEDAHQDISEVFERKIHELGGIKTLISRNHYSSEGFWRIYNQENYDRAKTILDPKGFFPDIFTKLGGSSRS